MILGTIGALAYTHIVADQQLAELQAQLDAANAKLTKTNQDRQQLASETSSVSDQIDALQASNDDLKKQLSEAKAAAAVTEVAPAPEINPLTLGEMMRGMMRGNFQGNQRLFLLQTRLHLSPEQANAIKTAMQADARARGEIMRQMFGRGGRGGGGQGGNGGPGGQGGQGGPGGPGGPGGGASRGAVDPALMAKANTLEETLSTVLTPQQKIAYQQVQSEEQTARADTQATTQVNQLAPLLQLTDAQRDQMVQQLYQVQMQAPDPTTLMTNPNATSVITQQAQATQAALAKVLNTDQLSLYQQAGQAATQNQQGGRGGNGGANGTNAAAGAPPAAGGMATAATTATGATNAASSTTNAASASPPSTTNAAASSTDSTTNAAASTNAASSGDTSGSTTNSTQATAPQ